MTVAIDTAEAARTSSEIIRAGSKSFAAASMLFGPQTRLSAHQLYAWCRHCDDVIDGQELGFRNASVASGVTKHDLMTLRQRTADALAGKPTADPVFQGFQTVMQTHRIPSRHAFELLDGFAMDVDGRTYGTIEDTLSYCYHVAGVVGVMMAMIMGVRDEATLDRASDLGIGFQLTNIARDIIDDAEAGRCYLPSCWLTEEGLSPSSIVDRNNREKVASLASRLVALGEAYYTSSRYGMAQLSFRSGWAVGTARSVYRKIGREVVRRGPEAWTTRVSTSKSQKVVAALTGGAVAIDALSRGRLVEAPPRVGLWSRPRA